MSSGNDLLTIDEAAERVRMSTRHVRRLLAEGQIVYHRLGRAIRIYTADLDTYIASGRVDLHAIEGRDAEIATALSELAKHGNAATLPRSVTIRTKR